MDAVGKEFGGIDILIHTIAFSREIKKLAIDTSRAAYPEALGISAYSLTRCCGRRRRYMATGRAGRCVVGLTYLGGERVVPHYGGGMSTAKAALQIDAKQLAHNLGPKNIRVNLISAGPYASRAARSIPATSRNRSTTRPRVALAARHHAGRGGRRHAVPGAVRWRRRSPGSPVRRLRLQRHGRCEHCTQHSRGVTACAAISSFCRCF